MLPVFIILAVLSLLEGAVFLVSHVANSNVFPQPLSPEEEEKCLNRMKAGDLEARNILVERNLRLVAHIVKKFDNTGQDADDLISIGTIGLIKAIGTYDQSKKTRLATYAARCIENEILMYLRSNKKTKSEVMLHEPIGSDKEGNEITLIDVLGTEHDVVVETVENEIEKAKLREKLKNLTKRELKVLEMRFGLIDGVRYTQREIAKKLGISRSYVSRIEKKAITKLHKNLCADL
ncbi:MAG: RNA polymerase sporulation sigma factor SigK [Firmicutes bacterium]|nr:RNA polymerase sporulation sigma factor SigK [Bacillota bacterium]